MQEKILFVDDDSNVLQGLRRSVRVYREDFTAFFANSGAEALALLEREPSDILVTDMRMPGMNGAELMSEVRKKYPSTVRIVLSGQCDEQTTLQSITLAHQFLSKPSDSTALAALLKRICAAMASLPNVELRNIVCGTETLPCSTEDHRRLTAALDQDTLSVRSVASIISSDIGLTAKILQLISSSFFGTYPRETTIPQAVEILGASTLRKLAANRHDFAAIDEPARLTLGLCSLAAHSIRVRDTAANLSASNCMNPISSYFATMAALLHDIGAYLFAVSRPAECIDLLSRSLREGIPITELERECFGVDHTVIGSSLLCVWGIPEEICAAVAFHHNPAAAPASADNVLPFVHAGEAVDRAALRFEFLECLPLYDEAYLSRFGLLDIVRSAAKNEDAVKERGATDEQKDPVCR